MLPKEMGLFEGENCTLIDEKSTPSKCQEHLICVASLQNTTEGTCRLPCDRQSNQCPVGRYCQRIVDNDLKKEVGHFCLAKQSKRDGECQAYLDDAACEYNRVCVPSSYDIHNKATSLRCKDVCDLNGDKNACRVLGDTCVSVYEPLSASLRGYCGKAVPPMQLLFFISGKWPQCDHNASYYCQTPKEMLHSQVHMQCTELGSEHSVCLGLCKDPALTNAEASSEKECPEGLACDERFARNINYIKLLKDSNGKTIQCAKNLCEVAKPCPNECGTDLAECLNDISDPESNTGLCGRPYGVCAQPPEALLQTINALQKKLKPTNTEIKETE